MSIYVPSSFLWHDVTRHISDVVHELAVLLGKVLLLLGSIHGSPGKL